MKRTFKIVCASFLVCLTGNILAQTVLRDDVKDNENTPKRRVIPYTSLREADVTWEKVIWRYIDVREKINLPLFYPSNQTYNMSSVQNRVCLWDVIKKEVYPDSTAKGYQPGKIMAFPADQYNLDNGFVYKDAKDSLMLPFPQLISKLTYTYKDLVGANGQPVPQPYVSSDVIAYILKEDWFFDRQRSVMDVRILGICPVVRAHNPDNGTVDPNGTALMLFWIYYPQVRSYFANVEVFNRTNVAEQRTLEDIIWKRQFSSYIIQESNVYNRQIADYLTDGMARQLESETIKNKMFDFEHDMWEY